MCYPKAEGGKRCAVHMYGSRASLKAAELYSGEDKTKLNSIFAELRREGKERQIETPSSEEVRDFADQQRVRTKFDSAIPERKRNSLVESWVKAREESPDGPTFYAWQNMRAEAARQGIALTSAGDSTNVSETSLKSAVLTGTSFEIPSEPEEGSTPALLRDGLFSASSRTYGETYMEPAIRQILGLVKPSSSDHDAFDSVNNEKYEIKCSKVLKAKDKTKNNKLLTSILKEAKNNPLLRMVSIKDRASTDYSANVQNVKRKHFDKLAYVLLFKEGIQVFVVPTSEVNKDNITSWSDKHGRYDILGASGQFAVKRGNIAEHESKYFHSFVSWEKLVTIYEKLEGENEEGSK